MTSYVGTQLLSDPSKQDCLLQIAGVKFVRGSSILLSASSDKTARMWQATEDGIYTCAKVLTVRPLLCKMSLVV